MSNISDHLETFKTKDTNLKVETFKTKGANFKPKINIRD